MKIHVYAICWNEKVLLPYFLRHYEGISERIVIFDNASDDGSVDIINSHPKTHLITYHTDGELRDDAFLEIKNNAWKESRGIADYVIVCDIDEIVYHANLLSFLKEKKAEGYILFETNGHVMVGSSIPTGNGMIYEEIDKGVPDKWSCKCVLFDPSAIEEINYAPGCHGCSAAGKGKMFSSPELKLLHYKYLGLNYTLTRKKLCETRLSKLNKEKGWSSHFALSDEYYTDLYKQLRAKARKVVGGNQRNRR